MLGGYIAGIIYIHRILEKTLRATELILKFRDLTNGFLVRRHRSCCMDGNLGN